MEIKHRSFCSFDVRAWSFSLPSKLSLYRAGEHVMWLLCLFAEFTVVLSVPCMRMNMNTSMKIGFGTREHTINWNNSSMIRNNFEFFSFISSSIPPFCPSLLIYSFKEMLFHRPPDISPLICSTKIYIARCLPPFANFRPWG